MKKHFMLILLIFALIFTTGAYVRVNGYIGDATGVSLTLTGDIEIDAGTGFTAVQVNGSTGGCFMIRDTDDAGWSQGTLLNGVVTWAADDGDGVCD